MLLGKQSADGNKRGKTMNYEIGLIFVDDKDYSNKAQFCNENGLIIKEIEPKEDGTRQFQICEIPAPTEEELAKQKAEEEAKKLEADRLPALEEAVCEIANLLDDAGTTNEEAICELAEMLAGIEERLTALEGE